MENINYIFLKLLTHIKFNQSIANLIDIKRKTAKKQIFLTFS